MCVYFIRIHLALHLGCVLFSVYMLKLNKTLTHAHMYIHKSLTHKNSLMSPENDISNISEEILLLSGFIEQNRKKGQVSS